ncbi:MAG: ABC transporter permease [Thermoleophilia bacterium]|nr:ABC transporter permease [Thermoleophilia bacterium]
MAEPPQRPGTHALGGLEMIRLIARREIGQRMRARSFLIGTVLIVVALVAVGLVNRIVADDGPGTIDIGLVAAGDSRAPFERLATAAGEQLDRPVSVTDHDDLATARAALRDGDLDVVVDAGRGRALFDTDVDDQTLALVRQAWSQVTVEARLGDAGLSPAQITEALSAAPLEAVTVDADDGPSGLAVLTGTVAAVLLFLSLQTFGAYVLTGVVEEKSSAVVEVLLVRARPDRLLAGKVIGIGVAALVQFASAVAAGFVALAISGLEVPGEIWSSVPLMLVWFLGGFTMYSTLYALAGSLVSRQEDAQSAAAPIGYALVAAYLLVFIFGYDPESLPSTVLSMLPPFAPFVMPMRMAAGAASAIEVVVAVAGLALATFAAWKLSARIYEQVLLRRGSRIAWRDALRLLRHS